MIRFLCPTCSAKVQAPDEKAAQSGRCPKCGETFTVPQGSTFALEISEPLPAPPIESSAPIPAAPPLPDELIEAPLVEAPTRADMGHTRSSTPITRTIDDDLPEESTAPAKPRGFHPMTIATGAALLLVIVITIWKLTAGPATTEAKAPPSKPARTPWFTFVPPDDPNARPKKARPTPTSQRAPQDFRPAPKKSAFSPSVIRPEFEERETFDPPAKLNTNVSRPVKPVSEIPTTPVIAAPVAADQTVYVASLDGQLYAINAESLKLTEKNLDYPVLRLMARDSKLIAEPKGQFRKTLIDFGHTVEIADPEDSEPPGKLIPIAGKTGPQTWRFNYNEQVVSYRGSFYCPRMGEVYELSGTESKTYQSHVPQLARWRIALLPFGPMGYDNTSVYQLDEHLCPTRRLIDVNQDRNDPFTYFFDSSLASDGKTLCFLTVQKKFSRMTIWSMDGKEKFRDCAVTTDHDRNYQGQNFRAAGRRLFALGDGYLYCGGELTWLPAGEGDCLRFIPQAPKKLVALDGRKQNRLNISNDGKQLTPPLITGDKLFVAFEAGGVFVFDISAFKSGGGAEE